MSVAQVTIKGQGDICGLGCHWRPCECLRAVFPWRREAGGTHADLSALVATWAMLLLGALSRSMVLWHLGSVLMSQAHVTTKAMKRYLVWTAA